MKSCDVVIFASLASVQDVIFKCSKINHNVSYCATGGNFGVKCHFSCTKTYKVDTVYLMMKLYGDDYCVVGCNVRNCSIIVVFFNSWCKNVEANWLFLAWH